MPDGWYSVHQSADKTMLNLCRVGLADRTGRVRIHEPFHAGLVRISFKRAPESVSQGLALAVQDILEVILDLLGGVAWESEKDISGRTQLW